MVFESTKHEVSVGWDKIVFVAINVFEIWLLCFGGFESTKHVVSVRLGYQVIPHRATVRVPKIQAVYGVVGILKCLAGVISLE